MFPACNHCILVGACYHTARYILVCVAAPAPTVFRVQKGPLVMSHGFTVHAWAKAHVSKILAATHMIFESDPRK